MRQHNRGLVLECKYSERGPYVASGYEQVIAYAAEMLGTIFDNVEAAVVGPTGVISTPGFATTATGRVYVVPADSVQDLVRRWLL